MILPRGITGFWGVNEAPPPFLDEKAFCQMCHALARKNGGAVTETGTDTAARNFYFAKLSRHDHSVFILQNIHYPCIAAELGRTGADPLLETENGWGDHIQYLGLTGKLAEVNFIIGQFNYIIL